MSVETSIVITAFLCGAIGMIGGLVLKIMIDRSESYMDEHPPDSGEKIMEGDEHDEH